MIWESIKPHKQWQQPHTIDTSIFNDFDKCVLYTDTIRPISYLVYDELKVKRFFFKNCVSLFTIDTHTIHIQSETHLLINENTSFIAQIHWFWLSGIGVRLNIDNFDIVRNPTTFYSNEATTKNGRMFRTIWRHKCYIQLLRTPV